MVKIKKNNYQLEVNYYKLLKFWNDFLSPKFLTGEYFYKLLKYLQECNNKNLLENRDLYSVFKAYQLTNPRDLKVVIITDTKYNTNGIPFSVNSNVNDMGLNNAIQNIAEEVEFTIYEGMNLDFDYSLKSWASQGVLMMNLNMINFKDKKNRSDIFRKFNLSILKSILETKTGIHYCLWGEEPRKLKKYINPKLNYIYENDSPDEDAINWACNDFLNINNKILKNNELEEEQILW